MMRIAAVGLLATCALGCTARPAPRPMVACDVVSESDAPAELERALGDHGAPLIVSGHVIYRCGCGARTLAGETQSRAVVGAAQDRALAGASEDRALAGASEDRALAGASEDRALAGASEDRALAGASQDRRLAGASEGRALAGASQDRALAGASETRPAPPPPLLECYFEDACTGFRIRGVSRASVYDGELTPLRTTCVSL